MLLRTFIDDARPPTMIELLRLVVFNLMSIMKEERESHLIHSSITVRIPCKTSFRTNSQNTRMTSHILGESVLLRDILACVSGANRPMRGRTR